MGLGPHVALVNQENSKRHFVKSNVGDKLAERLMVANVGWTDQLVLSASAREPRRGSRRAESTAHLYQGG
jgi:hypothetical protein